ncbi:MAG: PEP-CTERM sorting domain-containing protein [Chthoniobacterales bacterium]|nr:PEP-CTERM sorting domain-containing protein [Chthoniobacterales bacterium]
MNRKSLLSLTVSFFALVLTHTEAAPISGDIAFAGRIQVDTGNVNTANSITQWINTRVEITDGDFSSIPNNTPASFTAPWIFNPSTPTPGLWSVGGFRFDLLTATILNQGNGFLNITGTGIVSSTNSAFDPTFGTFNFSAQNPRVADTFSFSAAQEVPEPGSVNVLLAGAGVLGGAVGFRRRRQRLVERTCVRER